MIPGIPCGTSSRVLPGNFRSHRFYALLRLRFPLRALLHSLRVHLLVARVLRRVRCVEHTRCRFRELEPRFLLLRCAAIALLRDLVSAADHHLDVAVTLEAAQVREQPCVTSDL